MLGKVSKKLMGSLQYSRTVSAVFSIADVAMISPVEYTTKDVLGRRSSSSLLTKVALDELVGGRLAQPSLLLVVVVE